LGNGKDIRDTYLLFFPREGDKVHDFGVERVDHRGESNAHMYLGRVVASPSAGAMTHAQYKMHGCIYVPACSRTREHIREQTRARARTEMRVRSALHSSWKAPRSPIRALLAGRRRLSGNLGSGSAVLIDLQEVTEET